MLNKNPLVSVIVPCYKQVEFLQDALESVLNQSWSHWECIVINDGSPDNTEEVAKAWCNKNPCFKYLRKENGGLSSARNAGIAMAKGDYILPLDADDKISVSFIEKLVSAFLDKPEIKLACPQVQIFGSISDILPYSGFDYTNILLHTPFVITSLFRKKDFFESGWFDEGLIYGWEDWDFWLRLLGKEDRVTYVPDAIFFYRKKPASMMLDIYTEPDKYRYSLEYIFKKHQGRFLQTFSDLNIYLLCFKNEFSEIKQLNKLYDIYKVLSKFNKVLNAFDSFLIDCNHRIFELMNKYLHGVALPKRLFLILLWANNNSFGFTYRHLLHHPFIFIRNTLPKNLQNLKF